MTGNSCGCVERERESYTLTDKSAGLFANQKNKTSIKKALSVIKVR